MKKDFRLNIDSALDEFDISYYNIKEPMIDVYGIIPPTQDGELYRRVPKDVCDKVYAESNNDGVEHYAKYTTCGRIRFCTDSPYIAIKTKVTEFYAPCHIPFTCVASVDLYQDSENGSSRLLYCYGAPTDMKDGYEMIRVLADRNVLGKQKRYFTIYLPAFATLQDMYIGIAPDCTISNGLKYLDGAPIVIYGSSIVHGVCADRAGTVYPATLTRMLNRDVTSLGFAGSAKGEVAMAEYISTLKMSAFVYDYDHNAPSLEHLIATHDRFYKIIRKAQPNIPIIFMTKPIFRNDDLIELKRRQLIYNNFLNARERGENVWFIDGEALFGFEGRDDATTDFVHPNAFGYHEMAKAVAFTLHTYCNL